MSIPFCEHDRFVSLLFDEHPQPMWAVDVATRQIIAVNAAALRQYGYTQEQFLAMTTADLQSANDYRVADAELERMPLRSFTTQHVTATGMRLDIEMTSSACTILGRDTMLVMARDITATRSTAMAWSAAQARLEYILATTPAVTYVLTIEGDQLTPSWVSENVLERFGYSPEEALRPHWWAENVHPDDLQSVLTPHPSMLSDRERVTEFRFRCATGGWRWIHDEQHVVFDANGVPREIVGAWLDVTEQRRLQQELWQNQKSDALGRFAGGIAHDFNNILTVVRSYADFALESLAKGDAAGTQNEITEIGKAVERAGHLTRQLLDFNRREPAAPQELSLNQVMSGVTTMLHRVIGEDVELIVTPHEPLWTIRADRGQLEQILVNLAANARDAMPHGGQLFIRTACVTVTPPATHRVSDQYGEESIPAGAYVLLSVTDTGMGMDAATRERIFEPFFTTKAPSRGTGLGLATVHSIVRQSGGCIRVQSTVNGGTTFRLYFPRSDAQTVTRATTLHLVA